MKKALVTGAGGFIGNHMVNYLKERGYWVRGLDIKDPEFGKTNADDFLLSDARILENCREAVKGMDEVYNFAANMGGIGFIETVHAEVMYDNVLINAQMLDAAYRAGVGRYFYSSSACIYPTYKQTETEVPGLKEDDAYPADPDNEYGWEKLYTERMCMAYHLDYGMETRIGRFHNIYGPYGTWYGGREKAPAAVCRKVAMASNPGTIEIWGDGEQGRSFCYVDDCTEAVYRLTHSDFREPLNIGSDRLVSINELVDIVSKIAGKKVERTHDLSKPQGVRGRNSDNTLIKQVLGWAPSITLEEGLSTTYKWINEEVKETAYAEVA